MQFNIPLKAENKTHLLMAYSMHSSKLFCCVETNSCCKTLSLSTDAVSVVSSGHSVSGLFKFKYTDCIGDDTVFHQSLAHHRSLAQAALFHAPSFFQPRTCFHKLSFTSISLYIPTWGIWRSMSRDKYLQWAEDAIRIKCLSYRVTYCNFWLNHFDLTTLTALTIQCHSPVNIPMGRKRPAKEVEERQLCYVTDIWQMS